MPFLQYKYIGIFIRRFFGQLNIFDYLFVNSSKLILIFAQNLILMLAYLFVMKKVYLDIVYPKISSVKFYLEEA